MEKEQKNDSALEKLEELKKSNTKPFFLWHLYFAEVFEEKSGFDIVIANPTAQWWLKRITGDQIVVSGFRRDRLIILSCKITFWLADIIINCTYSRIVRRIVIALKIKIGGWIFE